MIKRASVAVLGALACGSPHASEDRVIIPGQRIGAIVRTTGLADLRRIYGASNVQPAEIAIGEGETVPGAIVFPGDSMRRVEVAWHDSTAQVPRFVAVRGGRSAWHTDAGITLGSSLARLAELNGHPFVLLGFGWDYAGTVVSWQGGTLGMRDSSHTRFVVRLQPSAGGAVALQENVLGDREYHSNDAGMAALAPAVYEMVTIFE